MYLKDVVQSGWQNLGLLEEEVLSETQQAFEWQRSNLEKTPERVSELPQKDECAFQSLENERIL